MRRGFTNLLLLLTITTIILITAVIFSDNKWEVSKDDNRSATQFNLNKWDVNDYENETDNLFHDLQVETGFNYSPIGKSWIMWFGKRVGDDKKVITKRISVDTGGWDETYEKRSKIAFFLHEKGFETDKSNIADGVKGGITGYKRGDIVCHLEHHETNISVSCGVLN